MNDLEKDTDSIELPKVDELTSLKARADMMGVSYHPKIGVDALRTKIQDRLDGKVEAETAAPSLAKAGNDGEESEGQRRARLKKEANKLVRINVTCNNPAKKEWDGEIFTAGNALVGTFKKFVPFNTTDGWHVPHAIYLMLKHREFQDFYNEKSKNGVSVRKGRIRKEFNIEIMDPLTEAELKELGRRQAMAAGQTV